MAVTTSADLQHSPSAIRLRSHRRPVNPCPRTHACRFLLFHQGRPVIQAAFVHAFGARRSSCASGAHYPDLSGQRRSMSTGFAISRRYGIRHFTGRPSSSQPRPAPRPHARRRSNALHRLIAIHLGHHDVDQGDVDILLGRIDALGARSRGALPRHAPQARWSASKCCGCHRR